MHLTLINPNTNAATTQSMLRIAQLAAGKPAHLDALTAPFGVPLIVDEASLAVARDAVMALHPALRRSRPDGVVIAAFGDPGRERLSRELECPVVGIAEAGMSEAAQGGRRFSVVTTTPHLVASIMLNAQQLGLGSQCLGVRLTPGDPRALMADPRELERALLRACERAAVDDGAQAIVIGGGPLAVAAGAVAHRLPLPVIEPIAAGVRRVMARVLEDREAGHTLRSTRQ